VRQKSSLTFDETDPFRNCALAWNVKAAIRKLPKLETENGHSAQETCSNLLCKFEAYICLVCYSCMLLSHASLYTCPKSWYIKHSYNFYVNSCLRCWCMWYKKIIQIKLTSCSWALLEKLPVTQLLKNFQTLYGTQRFITVFTRALHWFLSWARSIQ
jgi:hypothetical protein